MPRPCTVCTHADRPAIDQELGNGQPYRTIAHSYGVSKTALLRHQDHRTLEAVHVPDHVPDQALAAAALADLHRQAASVRVQAEQLRSAHRSYHEYPSDTLVVQMALLVANMVEILWPADGK